MDDAADLGMSIDEEFGAGVLDRVSRAAAEDVEQQLAKGNLVEAAFSAAHFCVLAGRVGWSEDAQRRMVDALRAAAGEDVRMARPRRAVWRGAYLRMLTQQAPDVDDGAVSALRQDVEDRLASGDLGVVCAGMCVDVWLLAGEWVAPKAVSEKLADAVRTDVQNRLERTDDDVMAADRVTLWLLTTTASGILR